MSHIQGCIKINFPKPPCIFDIREIIFKLFADDAVLYVDAENISQGEEVISAELLTIENCMGISAAVNLNPSKTVAIKSKPKPAPALYFANQQLEIVTHHKHLGLEFSSKLT